ncbi:EFR1 family ferrodoxin [Caproicibacter sp.]|uniref:EFR1 family ferrodoxin n=1 Tax=Caproicibacter sp. TaxID=2814884 RepID=UPI003989BD74
MGSQHNEIGCNMELKTVELIYFSPTGTTRKTVRAVAEGTGASILRETDLTRKENRVPLPAACADLLILGVPVYAGRVPAFLLSCLNGMDGGGRPAVFVAVYGGIDYGVTLNELAEIAEARGFVPAAAGAFLGQHSFSTPDFPVEAGRPNEKDLAAAQEFGRKITQKLLAAKDASALSFLIPKGKIPLPGRILPKSAAKAFARPPRFQLEFCPRCGACARICPMGAIDPNTLRIDEKACIRCFACVRACPKGARAVQFRFGSLPGRFLQRESKQKKEARYFL